MPKCSVGSSSNDAQYSWLIAVGICVVASTISNFGLNLQKLALTRKALRIGSKSAYRTLWILGFFGIVGGAIGDFAALVFGAQSVVAPLGSLTLVANVVIAPLFLGEKITRRDFAATGLIVFGCIIAVAFAQHKDCLYTLHQLFELYTKPTFAIYITCVVSAVVGMMLAIRAVERIQKKYGSASPEYKAREKFHRFSYACVSGIVGAQSILFAKTTVELVTDSIRGGTLFLARAPSYGILLGMGTSVTLQIYWLNCGLARWDALYNVPIFQSFWIFVSVIGGGVFYSEFSDFTWYQAIMFPVGVILTIGGVYILSQRESSQQNDSVSTTAGLLSTPSLWPVEALKEADVTCQEVFLGIALRKTRLMVTDAANSDISRQAEVWKVSGFQKDASGNPGPVELSGIVEVGAILSGVNGESVLEKWLDPVDALRRLTHTLARPIKLSFRHLPETSVSLDPSSKAVKAFRAALEAETPSPPSSSPSPPSPASPSPAGSSSGSEDRSLHNGHGGDGETKDTDEQRDDANKLRFAFRARTSSALSDDLGLQGAVLPSGVGVIVDAKHQPATFNTSVLPGAARRSSLTSSSSRPRLVQPASDPLHNRPHPSHAQRRGTVGSLASLDINELDAADIEATSRAIGLELEAVSEVSSAVLPVPSEAAQSSGDAIVRAHQRLQNVTMDPLAGLLHMGSLIYPGAIDKTTKDDSRHPLVSLVEKLLPYEKKQWTVLDRFLNSLGRIGDVAKRHHHPDVPASRRRRASHDEGDRGYNRSMGPLQRLKRLAGFAPRDRGSRLVINAPGSGAGAGAGAGSDGASAPHFDTSSPIGVEFSPMRPTERPGLPPGRERSVSDITFLARGNFTPTLPPPHSRADLSPSSLLVLTPSAATPTRTGTGTEAAGVTPDVPTDAERSPLLQPSTPGEAMS